MAAMGLHGTAGTRGEESELSIIHGVERQPLVSQVERLIAALRYIGSPIADEDEAAIQLAMGQDDQAGMNAGTAVIYSGADDLPPTFCVADGVGATCPCGNLDPSGGCTNSTGSGARLIASGSTSVSKDNLVFSTIGIRTLHSALLSVTPGQEYADPIDLVI